MNKLDERMEVSYRWVIAVCCVLADDALRDFTGENRSDALNALGGLLVLVAVWMVVMVLLEPLRRKS